MSIIWSPEKISQLTLEEIKRLAENAKTRSNEEVKDLVKAGMYVGSHGYSHLWLNHESYASQENEIDRSLEFLDEVGAPTEDWIMCYPYGAYNQDTIAILQKKKCALAITTEVKLANLSEHHPLALPRFDTNDFPQ